LSVSMWCEWQMGSHAVIGGALSLLSRGWGCGGGGGDCGLVWGKL